MLTPLDPSELPYLQVIAWQPVKAHAWVREQVLRLVDYAERRDASIRAIRVFAINLRREGDDETADRIDAILDVFDMVGEPQAAYAKDPS